jgi:hypothetical protein
MIKIEINSSGPKYAFPNNSLSGNLHKKTEMIAAKCT